MVAVMMSQSVKARTMMMTSMTIYCHINRTAWSVLAAWLARTNKHVHPNRRVTLSLHGLKASVLCRYKCDMRSIFFVLGQYAYYMKS